MSETIVAIIGIHQGLETAGDDLSRVASLKINNEMAEKIASTATTSKGGKIVGQVRGNLVIEIPADEAEVIRDIKTDIYDKCHFSATIGVGSDLQEAQTAFNYASKHNPGQIKVYDLEVAQSINTEQSWAAVSPDDKVKKAEGDDDSYEPISDEDKAKIKQTLEMIKKNKQLFDQMQQQAPEVYAGVVGIVNSLALILKEEKVKRDQKVAETIRNLAAKMQEQRDQKIRDDRAEIINELDIDKQLTEQADMEELHQRLMEDGEKDLQSKKEAMAYAKKVGHPNYKFFHLLSKAFKD